MKQVADFSEFNGFVDWRQLAGRIDGAVIRLGYRGYGSAGALAGDSRAGKYAIFYIDRILFAP